MALNPQFAATIIKVEANFGFAGFECDPDVISDQLSVQPDKVRQRGQVHHRGHHRIVASSNNWAIVSDSDSKDVNEHLRQLLRRLAGCVGRLDVDWGVPYFEVHYKATHLANGNGPFFEADVVRGIADLGAELWQDIYALDDPVGEVETG